MMTRSLKEKFIEAVSSLTTKSNTEEVTTLIHRTPWVRILLEHDQQGNNSLLLEVEMTFPEDANAKEFDPSELIDRLSEHLKYLQKLREVGFELSIIGTGCIYCASKELDATPEDNLFRALIPP
ncbi:MAG: hypothetical protein ACXAEF_06885 [Candidatus Thorarchaeota archaeon]|jgi:hypothetical protein